jgi:hypothetical protein
MARSFISPLRPWKPSKLLEALSKLPRAKTLDCMPFGVRGRGFEAGDESDVKISSSRGYARACELFSIQY